MVFTSKFSWLNFAKGEENDHLFKHTNGSGCHSTVMQILKGGGSALCMQALEPHLPSQVGYLALFNLLIHLAICLIYCACVGEGLGVEWTTCSFGLSSSTVQIPGIQPRVQACVKHLSQLNLLPAFAVLLWFLTDKMVPDSSLVCLVSTKDTSFPGAEEYLLPLWNIL